VMLFVVLLETFVDLLVSVVAVILVVMIHVKMVALVNAH
jgi:hypothetical protein